MLEKLEEIEKRYQDILDELSQPDIFQDARRFQQLSRDQKSLEPIMKVSTAYRELHHQIEEDKAVLRGDDAELKLIVEEELDELQMQRDEMESSLKILLIPKDPNDDKNTIIEVRAGTGGEEAALFAADLYRMYSRFAERQGWKKEVLSLSEADAGGIKEISFLISGEGAYGILKWESGVHRVQRVPVTESSGRIHTSAATVAVLPEASEVELDIPDKDIRIDTYRASGAGGQHVNKTESAIRITHFPTGIVVTCQDEKSQHKNKDKALTILYSRVLSHQIEEQQAAIAAERRSQVSTGDRSAKIRTYNYPQGRVTDHRINYTSHQLAAFIDGDIYDLTEQLKLADNLEKLNQL